MTRFYLKSQQRINLKDAFNKRSLILKTLIVSMKLNSESILNRNLFCINFVFVITFLLTSITPHILFYIQIILNFVILTYYRSYDILILNYI